MTCNVKLWLKGAVALGAVFLLAVWLVKPIGVSTQFVILNGIIGDIISEDIVTISDTAKNGYESTNAYLNKSGGKYAKSIANPLNYSFIFVLSMMVGAFISAKMRGGQSKKENQSPQVWRERFGNSIIKRYAVAFVAGILVLYGARLAGGCTSGHMMSGIMQTSLSGYLFTLGAFVTAIPVAILTFRKRK